MSDTTQEAGDLTASDTNTGVSAEMPKYKSHKIVWALKIANIQLNPAPPDSAGAQGAVITPADEGYAGLEVDADYVNKHNPQVGGYYVVYADGYKSWSPAEAFEDGYSPLVTDSQPSAEPVPTQWSLLGALPPYELHLRAMGALQAFQTIAGQLPKNRCYDGFTRLNANIVEMVPGADEYGERLKLREPDTE